MTEIEIHGWTIYLDSLFLEQYRELMGAVAKARAADPENYEFKRAAKLFAATRKLIFEDIPRNSVDPRFRLGTTLGEQHKHWFRAKYFQQYRIFFRFSEKDKVIIFAWMNDEDTKRACDSKTDAYRVFRKMLERGQTAGYWAILLQEAKKATAEWTDDL